MPAARRRSRPLTALQVRRNGLADQVIDRVRTLIGNGTYRVGDRLPAEAALCEVFGVGRSTLREAMRALANRGLVDVRHGGGTFIAAVPRESLEERLDRAELAEIYEARLHLELPLAVLASERRDTRDVSVARYIEADFAFHRAVAKAAKNAALCGVYESFIQAVEARLTGAVTPEYLRAEDDHLHDELCEAIARADSNATRRLVTAHLKASLDGIGRILA
jgi:DNA-binding FadR family transcriptional regulator